MTDIAQLTDRQLMAQHKRLGHALDKATIRMEDIQTRLAAIESEINHRDGDRFELTRYHTQPTKLTLIQFLIWLVAGTAIGLGYTALANI